MTKKTGLGDIQLGASGKGNPPEEPKENVAENKAEVVLSKKLHEHVIEKIQSSDKVSDEDKAKAVTEINRLVEAGQVNLPDWDKIDLSLGSPLGSLFAWKQSKLAVAFWSNLNSKIVW